MGTAIEHGRYNSQRSANLFKEIKGREREGRERGERGERKREGK